MMLLDIHVQNYKNNKHVCLQKRNVWETQNKKAKNKNIKTIKMENYKKG